MTPDEVIAKIEAWRAEDAIEEFTPDRPLPPHYADALALAEQELQAASADIAQWVFSEALAFEELLRAAEIPVNESLSIAVGTIDADLRAVQPNVYKALDRQTDALFRDFVYLEEEVKGYGHAIPESIDQKALDIADTTGESIADRLAGIYPTYSAVPEAGPAAEGGPGTAQVGDALANGSVRTPDVLPGVSLSGGPAGGPIRGDGPVALSPAPPPAAIAPGTPLERGPCPPGEFYIPWGHPDYPPSEWNTCFLPGVPSSPAPPAPSSPAPAPIPVPATLPPICPAPVSPPAPPLPTSGAWNVVVNQWTRDDVCPWADGQIEGVHPPRPDSRPLDERLTEWTLENSMSILSPAAGATWDLMKSTGWFSASDAGKKVSEEAGILQVGLDSVYRVIDRLSGEGLPNPGAAVNYGGKLALAGTAERITDFPLGYLMTSELYLYQYANPQFIPAQGELNFAYIHDEITSAQWHCLTRAQGNLPDGQRWVVSSQRVRPGVLDTVSLYRRGAIDHAAYHARLRKLGVMSDSEREDYLRLTQWIPSPTDLPRYMIRDVEVPEVVKEQGLDTGFEARFFGPGGRAAPGKIAEWARAQGVSEEVFLYDWRAHWVPPSNTIVFDGLHRLRPDRREVKEWEERAKFAAPEFGGIDPGPRPLTVTYADAKELLTVNDMFPAWIDRALAMSYLPMNRTDALSAFHANTMSAEELHERLQDVGYDRATASRIVEIQTNLRARRLANVSGTWSVRKIVKSYKAGEITRGRADQLARPLILDDAQRAFVLDSADTEVQAEITSVNIARIRRAYFTGAEEEDWVRTQLQAAGVEMVRRDTLVAKWDLERRGRYREPTARQIVSWAKDLLIQPEDAFLRLTRLGYLDEDARRIVYQGILAASDKIEGRVEKAQRRAEKIVKDARQAKKELTKDMKDRQKELEKQIEKMKKEQARIQKELDKRAPG